METIYSHYSEYWLNDWEVFDRNEPNKKIWSVKYIKNKGKQKTINIRGSLADIKRSYLKY